MFNNPPAEAPLIPIVVIVLGLAIVGFGVGTAWLWRITRDREDAGSDHHWRYRR